MVPGIGVMTLLLGEVGRLFEGVEGLIESTVITQKQFFQNFVENTMNERDFYRRNFVFREIGSWQNEEI